MSKFIQKLDSKQKNKIKKMYNGSSKCIGMLSKRFNVARVTIEWIVNHNNRKQTARESNERWRLKNPEKTRIMHKKAAFKYYRSEKGKRTRRKYYLKKLKK